MRRRYAIRCQKSEVRCQKDTPTKRTQTRRKSGCCRGLWVLRNELRRGHGAQKLLVNMETQLTPQIYETNSDGRGPVPRGRGIRGQEDQPTKRTQVSQNGTRRARGTEKTAGWGCLRNELGRTDVRGQKSEISRTSLRNELKMIGTHCGGMGYGCLRNELGRTEVRSQRSGVRSQKSGRAAKRTHRRLPSFQSSSLPIFQFRPTKRTQAGGPAG